MKTYHRILTTFVMVMMLLTSESVVWPCGGTVLPPFCPRNVFLAKFAPAVVVIPPAGGPINVPIGVLPFAAWNNADPRCAVPVGAFLNLTLICTPVGGVIPTVIGPVAFPVPVPVVPGAQPLGAPLNFVIPAGIIPPGVPQVCLVVGAYGVTFGGGAGAGLLVGGGDAEVCLVEPSASNDTIPRLNMEYIPVNGELFNTCRRGDQAYSYYLLANNDLDNSVSLTLSSEGRQAAVLPDSADGVAITTENAYEMGVFSVSNPDSGTDVFAAEFTDNLAPGELLPEPDPFAVDVRLITTTLDLLPGEAKIVGIATRSFGACANGSCGERNLKATGSFANGDTALACASTLYLVDDVPGKTPMCEITDTLKVGPFMDVLWSSAHYNTFGNDLHHSVTFLEGNLPPELGGPGFLTRGAALGDTVFLDNSGDLVRTPIEPEIVQMNLTSIDQQTGILAGNNVEVRGLNLPLGGQFVHPLITFQPPQPPFEPNLDIIYDLPLNQLLVQAGPQVLYNGPIDLFFQNPPQPLIIDPQTCRTFKKVTGIDDEKTFTVTPRSLAHLFTEGDTPDNDTLLVTNDQNGMPEEWNATLSGDGLVLPQNSGIGDLPVGYDLTGLPLVPQTTLGFVDVTCPGALNNVLTVPIAIRLLESGNTFNAELLENWNMISLPLAVADPSVETLYPGHTPNSLFSFNGGYQPEDSLRDCEGFWLRFAAATTVNITGELIDSCWIDLQAGWNLTGGPSCDVLVADIEDPQGIIAGNIFGWNGAYFNATVIEQGQAYWIFATEAGMIHLGCDVAKQQPSLARGTFDYSRESHLTISDANGASQTLYFNVEPADISEAGEQARHAFKLPPISPPGTFDARFSNDLFLAEGSEMTIRIQASQYPLTITAVNIPATHGIQYVFKEMAGNEVLKTHQLHEGQTVEISNAAVKRLVLSKADNLLPTAFHLHQNYPNPFNPSTVIKYELPEKSKVQIVIYNAVGESVKTMIARQQEAGYYEVTWDATNDAGQRVTSGVYFYRLKAGDYQAVKKMVLLR